MPRTVPERFPLSGMRHGLHEQRQSVGKNQWWLSATVADRRFSSESVPVLRMLADEQSLHLSEQQPVPERICLHRFSELRTEQHSSGKQRFSADVLQRESASFSSVSFSAAYAKCDSTSSESLCSLAVVYGTCSSEQDVFRTICFVCWLSSASRERVLS